MHPGAQLCVFILTAIFPVCIQDQDATLKTLSNRAGWSIQYPADWSAKSCHACEDLTDTLIEFVDFHPPRYEGGSVKLEISRRKPDGVSLDELFDRIKAPNSRDAYILEEERVTVEELPALLVVYSGPAKTPGKGLQHEITFIIGHHNVFSIALFSPPKIRMGDPIIPIKQLKNYDLYQKMVGLFRQGDESSYPGN